MDVCGQIHATADLTPRKDSSVVDMTLGWWDPEPVWKLWGKEISLEPAGNRTPVVPIPRHEDVGGSGGIVPPILTSAGDRGEWPTSRPSRFTPKETAPRDP
jgi:hypothetical protein